MAVRPAAEMADDQVARERLANEPLTPFSRQSTCGLHCRTEDDIESSEVIPWILISAEKPVLPQRLCVEHFLGIIAQSNETLQQSF